MRHHYWRAGQLLLPRSEVEKCSRLRVSDLCCLASTASCEVLLQIRTSGKWKLEEHEGKKLNANC
jgi:hypothetical protein